MVSKLLGDDADSFICLLCPHSWIELGLEVNWKAELRGRLRPSLGRVRAGSVLTQQIPESVLRAPILYGSAGSLSLQHSDASGDLHVGLAHRLHSVCTCSLSMPTDWAER